jgi:hypothetical protein
MSDVTFEQVYELAKQLPSEERAELVERLQETLPYKVPERVTREQLIADFERKKADGAFNNIESLRGKYANPNVDVSAEEIQAYLHKIGTEWEKEIDDIIGND